MEYNLSKQIVEKEKVLLDTVCEQGVDMDISLPDYCRDIEKILKCTLSQNIYSRRVSGGQLTVDGASTVRILYVDSENKNIRCFEQTVDFSQSFELKSSEKSSVVLVDTKTEYVNCRALTPRKLTVHGAFSLYVKVITKEDEEFFCLDTDSDLQTKEKDIKVSSLCALCQEQFSVSEDFSVNDKPPVETVLSYDVCAEITECKSVQDKLMLSAEVSLNLMYLSDMETGEIEHISYVFLFNQIVDCEGVDEYTANNCMLEVTSSDLHIRSDAVNESTLLSLDTKLCFTVFGYKETDVKIIEDAYSTENMTDIVRNSITAVYDTKMIKSSCVESQKITLDSVEIDRVIDVSGKIISVTASKNGDSPKLSCKANICMLFIDKEQKPSYIERTVEYDCTVSGTYDFDVIKNPMGFIASVSYRLLSDCEIELRLETKLSCLLCKEVRSNAVCSVTSFDDKPIEKGTSALILCYADKGESIWDISKSYSTRPSRLLEENSLDCEILQNPMMLLIPTD
ncbi:MAG: DUF3794 domain-containing protein [Oscillospiraceae bacterium]|nr:DUF3794 domain-containing protein [Candidatus Ruminococcus equi]